MFSEVSPEKAKLPSWFMHLYFVIWSIYLCSQLIIMSHLGHQHHGPMSISSIMGPIASDTIVYPYEDTGGLQVLTRLITTLRLTVS